MPFRWLPSKNRGGQIVRPGSFFMVFPYSASFFRPRYNIDFNGWHVEGDFFEWDYRIKNAAGTPIAEISKQIWNWTDTYSIEVFDPQDALCALMLVLAIDAEKCSRD